ncbi:AfsR/SARP family transcriptional regulator [Kitasatospora sp. NPDC004240]
MRFGVLGPVAVWDTEGRPVRVPETKVRALLADLLVHEGRPVPPDRLVDDLWGEDPPGNPANALQAKVSQLRRALGRDRVTRQPAGYRLVLDDAAASLDAARFRSLAAAARVSAGPRERGELLGEALELWRGEPYADFTDEEFVRPAAQRLAEERLTVLEERAEARLAYGDPLLLGELSELVDRHPLRERLRAVRMRALYRAGRQGEAIAEYAGLRTLLVDELGLDPGPELTALHEAILRQDPALLPAPARPARTTPPPRETVDPPAHRTAEPPAREAPPRLPTPRTTLVGRGPALDTLTDLVRTERLVTLTGPGGVGKTRLALALAHRLAADPGPELPDGVGLVELAALPAGTTGIAQSVVAALGIGQSVTSARPRPGAPADPAEDPSTALLAAALRDRRTLLVLDNCEHVIEAAADLTAALLDAAPGLRVLATSRESLRLPGEAVHPVAPLEPADAARLFADRAAAAAPGFADRPGDEGTRQAVARICERLDGLPLALELAATRVRAMGVHELATRIGDRFRLLSSGGRGLPARQQTLRAVIDWSWDLLDPPERAVLRRLAVPAGGCSLRAAETLCAGDGVGGDEVLDLVARLVDRSLVETAHGANGPRYGLLESVAAYARDRLHEAGESAAVAARHARYYGELAAEAEAELRGPGQRRRLTLLDADAANLRAALDHDLSTGDTEAAVRLAAALGRWWLLRGRFHEARRTLAAVLTATATAEDGELRLLHDAFAMLTGGRPPAEEPAATDIPDPGRRGRALWLFAYGLHHAGDPARAAAVGARALDHSTAAAEPWGIAAARALLAQAALAGGDLATARREGRAAAEAFRELGDGWGALQTVPVLAALAEIEGDYAAAAARQREGLELAEGLGLAAEAGARRAGLGRLALLAGEWENARLLHEQARRAGAEQGNMFGEVFALMGLALGARRSGDLDAAERHLRTMLDDYPSSTAGKHLLHVELGFVAEQRGRATEAADLQVRALAFAERLGDVRALALSLEGTASAAAAATGTAARAALLLGAAGAARRSIGSPLPHGERADVDRISAAARAALGEAAYAAAYAEGAALPLAEAVRTAAGG